MTARDRELGDRLRRIRAEAGLTCRDLAMKLGWSMSTVSRIDTGRRPVTGIDMVRYAAVCGVNPDTVNELLVLCREVSGPGFWMSVAWRKSSYSNDPQGNCVEVGFAADGVAVRDSKNTVGPILSFGVREWLAFTSSAAVRPGRGR